MNQFPLLVLLSCLPLAACGERSAGIDGTAPGEGIASATASPESDLPTRGSIGPVEYGFAPERLTRAEIQLALPPGYETSVWATKLIPAERADLLGEESCRYGESGRTQTCTAEKENGLAMALLERPIADYRSAFLRGDIPEAELGASAVGGSRGFDFTAQAEGSGVRYGFYPVGERTLLLARRFSGGDRTVDPAIRSVLESIELPQQGL